MTAIVGVEDKGGVWIGVDSLGSDGWAQQNRADGKLFRRGPFLIGFTDSFRMGQLLQYRLDVPGHAPHSGLHEYMATEFIDAVRKCLKDGGFATRENEREKGGHFLVSTCGVLFMVHSDYQVARPSDGYAAVGGGHLAALGSLATSERLCVSAQDRVLVALEVAARHTSGVRGPFVLKRDARLSALKAS